MKSLIELDFEAKKKRYPNVPEHCLPKLKVKQNANGLTQAIDGKTLAIEVKVNRDKMSEAQLKVKAEIEAAGGIYFIAKSFDDFENFYNKIINIKDGTESR